MLQLWTFATYFTVISQLHTDMCKLLPLKIATCTLYMLFAFICARPLFWKPGHFRIAICGKITRLTEVYTTDPYCENQAKQGFGEKLPELDPVASSPSSVGIKN